jgi:hypothetical protein
MKLILAEEQHSQLGLPSISTASPEVRHFLQPDAPEKHKRFFI